MCSSTSTPTDADLRPRMLIAVLCNSLCLDPSARKCAWRACIFEQHNSMVALVWSHQCLCTVIAVALCAAFCQAFVAPACRTSAPGDISSSNSRNSRCIEAVCGASSRPGTAVVSMSSMPPSSPPQQGARPPMSTSRPPPRPSSNGGAAANSFGRGRGSTKKPVDEDRPPMNYEIKVPQVRVVIANAATGDEQLGVIDTAVALAKAEELGLDLIMISETAVPPVCKIIDYGKLKYLGEKKKKDSKKNTKSTEMKEVKMSYKIEDHDYQVRLKAAQKFISQGNRVKLVVQFRGREQQHMDLGHELMTKLVADCDGTVVTDGRPKREGNRLSMILAPKGT